MENEKKDPVLTETENDSVFGDLLKEQPISQLNISEPDMPEFDTNHIIAHARQITGNTGTRKKTLKRRADKERAAVIDSGAASFLEAEKNSKPAAKAHSFKELLSMNLLEQSQAEPDHLAVSAIVETEEKEQPVIDSEKIQLKKSELLSPAAFDLLSRKDELEKEPEPEVEEEVEVEEPEEFDPGSSLVDDYNYDEYEDKKSFLLSQFKEIEDYLHAQSLQGFHYTRHDGKKYYFIKGRPHNYWYKMLYFTDAPDAEVEARWDLDGWREVSHSPSRIRKDYGWIMLRNELEEGALPKDVENDEEKYRYFKKFTSSCRSTMFLLFMVMVISALTIWLQVQFKGFLAVIIISSILLGVSLIMFLLYARMMAKSKKEAALLAARVRLAKENPSYQKLIDPMESDQQLDAEWDAIDQEEK